MPIATTTTADRDAQDDADGDVDRRAGGGRRPPRPTAVRGGPRDGAGRGRGRRLGLYLAGVILFLLVIGSGVGLDLWTDALWFQSVGFDTVFWTRLGAQVVLFLGALVIAGLVLFGNLAPGQPARPAADGRSRRIVPLACSSG